MLEEQFIKKDLIKLFKEIIVRNSAFRKHICVIRIIKTANIVTGGTRKKKWIHTPYCGKIKSTTFKYCTITPLVILIMSIVLKYFIYINKQMIFIGKSLEENIMTLKWKFKRQFIYSKIFIDPSWYNPFIPSAPFLYSLKTSENGNVFRCFQGVENRCFSKEWVK